MGNKKRTARENQKAFQNKIRRRINRLNKKNKSFSELADKLKKQSALSSQNKPLLAVILGTLLGRLRTTSKNQLEIERNFLKFAAKDPELKPLINFLRTKKMSLEDFMNEVGLKKFLTTNYNPKGTINEFLVLNDKILLGLLRERAEGSFLNLYRYTKAELDAAVQNIKNKPFKLQDFKDIETALANDFKTQPNNKLYLDFGMVKFNAKNKQLLITIPGEIKEPKAARELAEQIAEIERRLRSSDEISFNIGKDKDFRVRTEDVFLIRENAVGVPRRLEESKNPNLGKDLKISGEVLDIVQLNSRLTKSPKDPQEFFRLLVKIRKEFNPDNIQKIMIDIKKNQLKIPHKST